MLGIHQALIEAIDPDGIKIQFVVLNDHRCAVIRQGESIYVGAGDQEGVQTGINVFSRLSKQTRETPVIRARAG